MPNIENSRSAKLDAIFGTPLFAVLLAIGCNVLWGSAFPFIKMGYRLFAIETSDTASILCFAGVRFMLGSLLVLAGSLILEGKLPQPPCGKVLGECCALGLWQTTAQYAFYYMAVALLTGAFGGILNSTQSFLGVIFAHFLYGDADRMTPAKTLGCVLGFAGVLIGTIGNHGGGSAWGVFCMLLATVIFTLSGPWNKSVTKKADSFAVCFLNLFVGGLALLLIGLLGCLISAIGWHGRIAALKRQDFFPKFEQNWMQSGEKMDTKHRQVVAVKDFLLVPSYKDIVIPLDQAVWCYVLPLAKKNYGLYIMGTDGKAVLVCRVKEKGSVYVREYLEQIHLSAPWMAIGYSAENRQAFGAYEKSETIEKIIAKKDKMMSQFPF